MPAMKPRFHEMLRQAREEAQQTPDVMAILLNLDEATYEAIERGERYPDNETLRRLCMMLEWNFYDTQRAIANEMMVPRRRAAADPAPGGAGDRALEALQGMPLETGPTERARPRPTLGSRMREVREETGQAIEVIAMLLGIDEATYERLEAGDMPSDELLRRISMVYDWNYYDLVALLRSQHIETLQPRRVGAPFPSSERQRRLTALLRECEQHFPQLAEAEQKVLLAQVELVRDTARRLAAAGRDDRTAPDAAASPA